MLACHTIYALEEVMSLLMEFSSLATLNGAFQSYPSHSSMFFCFFSFLALTVRHGPTLVRLLHMWFYCCRDFIEKYYVSIKQQNPKFPILIRECSGVQPRLWARYGVYSLSNSYFDWDFCSLLPANISFNQLFLHFRWWAGEQHSLNQVKSWRSPPECVFSVKTCLAATLSQILMAECLSLYIAVIGNVKK